MEIRHAERSEVEKFNCYNEDNAGNEFIVAVDGEAVVGFAQFDSGNDDATIYFMQSEAKGAGRAMMEWFQENFSQIVAHDAIVEAHGFYTHFGFEATSKRGFDGRQEMTWWAE